MTITKRQTCTDGKPYHISVDIPCLEGEVQSTVAKICDRYVYRESGTQIVVRNGQLTWNSNGYKKIVEEYQIYEKCLQELRQIVKRYKEHKQFAKIYADSE